MATNPTLLSMPLARDGDKSTIPETAGSTTGDFSQQYGFQQINQLPLGAGGIAPKRNDFNGAFNLLGGVSFFAQKGWTFHYDSTQDYYLGCVVIDPADGTRYECIADMAAGTVAPHEDTNGDYWRRYTLDDKANITGSNLAYHKDVITTSGTYTAPVTGLYKITVKGGGGGGTVGGYQDSVSFSGAGGGEGGTTVVYASLLANDTVPVVVGAGGAPSTAGGDSSVVIDNDSYVGGGGNAGLSGTGEPGRGGTGTIIGASGTPGTFTNGVTYFPGGTGGGTGGGVGQRSVAGKAGVNGGGGAGGNSYNYYSGTAGGNGYVWFEYVSAV